jgi:hypothetical protein
MHRNWLRSATITSVATCAILLQGCSGNNEAEQGNAAADAATTAPRVFIASPADGESRQSPVTVEFGIDDFLLAPAGTFEPSTGHHHLLVDAELPPLNQPIPSDANHLHFGKAQTETILELEPGTHTLQLLLGDGAHVPHDAALISERITITVE